MFLNKDCGPYQNRKENIFRIKYTNAYVCDLHPGFSSKSKDNMNFLLVSLYSRVLILIFELKSVNDTSRHE